MAPALVEPTGESTYEGPSSYKDPGTVAGGPSRYNEHAELNGTAAHPKARYPNYLPAWDFSVKLPPLEDFPYHEHGADADPSLHELLGKAQVSNITGNVGAEVNGVQISQLSDKGKDELALYVAQKKVVAFRDQDWADLPIQKAVDYVKYFGPLHVHPTSPAPKGYQEVHVVHRGAGETVSNAVLDDRVNAIAWHTDVSYERQPPGLTFLYMLEGPSAGGDTIFADMTEAYNRLSPEFQKRLHGLQAIHTGQEQAALTNSRGGHVRRDPVTSVHPVVRTHPATGQKALYVNAQFTRRIVGFKREESDMLLRFLFDHIALGQDFQARVRWAPGTVVCWDNRVTTHTAVVDWTDGQRRHIARITPQAEKPYETPF